MNGLLYQDFGVDCSLLFEIWLLDALGRGATYLHACLMTQLDKLAISLAYLEQAFTDVASPHRQFSLQVEAYNGS